MGWVQAASPLRLAHIHAPSATVQPNPAPGVRRPRFGCYLRLFQRFSVTLSFPDALLPEASARAAATASFTFFRRFKAFFALLVNLSVAVRLPGPVPSLPEATFTVLALLLRGRSLSFFAVLASSVAVSVAAQGSLQSTVIFIPLASAVFSFWRATRASLPIGAVMSGVTPGPPPPPPPPPPPTGAAGAPKTSTSELSMKSAP